MKKRLISLTLKIMTLLILVMSFSVNVSAANQDILYLYRTNPAENMTFNVQNMFPGDNETNVYNVRVSYNGTIKVYFAARIDDRYKKLAEVLMCKVVMPDGSTYEGLMRDMPDLEHTLNAVNRTEDLKYEITVYLDKSVGNEYKNRELVANFEWWAYTSDQGHPGGGGNPLRPSPTPSYEPVVTPTVEPTVSPGSGEVEPTESPTVTPIHTPLAPSPSPGEVPVDPQRPTGELINPPKTGDPFNPVLWIVLIAVSLFVILLIIFFGKKKSDKKEDKNSIIKKLNICILIIIILTVCLCATTFALVYSIVSVDENIFKTGTVEINLNNGDPIIYPNEFLFEPGMTVEKEFFIENQSSDEVYYKIYFDNVLGGLAKVLDVKIFDKANGTELYYGKAEGLIRENSKSAELSINETRILTAQFHYPRESGNDTQNTMLSFDMCAVATQKKNNDLREFN